MRSRIRRVGVLVLAASTSGACAGAPGRDAPVDVARTCALTLPESGPREPLAGAVDTRPVRPSSLVIEAEIPFARVARELEARVPRRIAEERGRDIGLAGSLDTTVDRGPFTVGVSAAGDALVVTTTLHAEARACTSSRGCYASCSPEAVATTTLPLALSEEYALGKPRVAVRLVRGCRVSALGGLVQLDLTPSIEAQLGPHVRRVEQEIARTIPALRPELVTRWSELSRPRELPLHAGCVSLHPSGLTQGPSSASADAVRLRFALAASPELRPRCDEPPPLHPYLLPPLGQDPGMSDEGELDVRVRLPLASFASATTGTAFTARGVRASARSASVRADGAGVAIDLGLSGEVCGDVRAHAQIGWKDDAHALGFASTVFSPPEQARLQRASVSPEALVAGLDADVRVIPKLAPESTKGLIPALVAALSAPDVELTALVSSTRPGDVRPDGEDALASTLVRGKLTARLTAR